MKKTALFLSLLIMFIPALGAGQFYPYYNEDDYPEMKNKRIPDIVTKHYENGNLKSETEYYGGQLDGMSKFYFENGDLYAKIPFNEGIKEGTALIYNEKDPYHLELEYKHNSAVSGYLVKSPGNKKSLSRAQLEKWNREKPVGVYINRINSFLE